MLIRLIHVWTCVNAGATPSGTAGLPICSWTSHTDGAIYKAPAACAPQAPISGPLFQNWGEGGGPGRCSSLVGCNWGPPGCGGEGPSSLRTRCHLGWALGRKLPLASGPLHRLFLQPGMPFLLGVTGSIFLPQYLSVTPLLG